MSPELALATPVAVALLGGMLSLAADAFDRRAAASALAAAGLTIGAVVAAVAAATVTPAVVWTVFVTGAGYSMAAAVVMALGAAAVVAGMSARFESNAALGGLVALSAVALAALASSTDLVVMLIALETAAVTGYALVALSHSPRAHEAALKYFIQGAVATALFVFGLGGALVSGALVFDGGRIVFGAVNDVGAATTAAVLILVAFAFKLGAFPFHSWAPDAYETAPPEAAAFLASAVKVAGLVATYVIATGFLGQAGLTTRLQWIIAGIAAGSIIFGNLAGLAQRSYTRLLAYSGIAQVGYGLIALVNGNGNAALTFATAYGCAAAGAFAAARAYRTMEPNWDGSIAGMAGLSRRAPVLAASLAVLLFSLTGIPPLFGFWGKLLVFLSAASDSTWLWLVVLGLIGSVVSFGYYGRVLRAVYFDDAVEVEHRAGPADSPDHAAPEEGFETAANAVDADATPSPDARTILGRFDAATAIVVVLALIVLIVGLVPIFAGLTRFVGTEPLGLFVIGF